MVDLSECGGSVTGADRGRYIVRNGQLCPDTQHTDSEFICAAIRAVKRDEGAYSIAVSNASSRPKSHANSARLGQVSVLNVMNMNFNISGMLMGFSLWKVKDGAYLLLASQFEPVPRVVV